MHRRKFAFRNDDRAYSALEFSVFDLKRNIHAGVSFFLHVHKDAKLPQTPKEICGSAGTPGWIRTSGLPLRSMAYHVIHGSGVTSNIIPYAE